MLNAGRLYIGTAWCLTAFPGLAIFVTVLAVNLVGDHLRDWLDPVSAAPRCEGDDREIDGAIGGG